VEAREAELRTSLLELDSTGEATLRVAGAVTGAGVARVPEAVVGVPVVAGVSVGEASSAVVSGAAPELEEDAAAELAGEEAAEEDEEDAGPVAGGEASEHSERTVKADPARSSTGHVR